MIVHHEATKTKKAKRVTYGSSQGMAKEKGKGRKENWNEVLIHIVSDPGWVLVLLVFTNFINLAQRKAQVFESFDLSVSIALLLCSLYKMLAQHINN